MTLLLLVINLNVCVSDSSWRSQRGDFYAGQRWRWHRTERDETDRLWGSLWMLWSCLCWHTSPALQDIITPLEWPTGVASPHYSSFASPDTEPRLELVSPSCHCVPLTGSWVCVWGVFFSLSLFRLHLFLLPSPVASDPRWKHFKSRLTQDKSWWSAAVGVCGSNRMQPTSPPWWRFNLCFDLWAVV